MGKPQNGPDQHGDEAMLKVALFVLLGFFILGHDTASAASCPAGKITCAQWCQKYRPGTTDCMTGGPRSCEGMGGPNTCVGGAAPKMISCEAWCDKYKGGSDSCKRTGRGSCIDIGGLKKRVRDRPPG